MSDAPDLTSAPLSIGRYQVTDRLGQGGMGVVYLARDPSLERFVAIKLMRTGFDSADLRERFVREARAVASLRHPCIVTLFEYGDFNGQPFIVMEYVNGKTLAALIGAGTPMSLVRRLQLIEDMCRGLEHAHKAGIIHRDVKPANIMVDGEGTLKILDFGIAKLGHAGITQISALVGTPKYMSPEQVAGKPVTRRSDIFSVGLVVYELLSGRPAYAVENDFAAMDAILRSEPTPLAITAPNLDPRIIRIVEKALEKDPDRRYQDLSQMRRDVDRIKMELALAEPGAQSTVGGLRLNKSAQLEELVRRRTQQIAANLENAERAFELGDYGAALAACEDALIIDPQDNRALEGLQRAQAALVERQALAHLNMARQHFAKDELTLAEGALNAAFELVPSLREGLDLQQLLGSARQQKEQRSRSLKLALDRARIRLGEGAFESALNAADEALNYDPLDSQAQRLKQEAIVGLDAERLQREADRQVKVAIDEAMRLAGRDRYGDALQLLSDPAIAAHPLARDARARIESAHSEFERLKAAAAARIAAARKDTGGAPKADEDDDRETVGPTPSPVAMSTPAPVAPRSIVPAPVVPPPVVDPTFVGVAPPAPVAPPVRRPEPPPGELTFVEPLDRTRPFAAPPRLSLLGEYDSPGFLPGPVRPRKPKPPRRPVVFLDKEADRGGAREWFHDQLFVTGKQGHDSFGFGVSVTTHVVLGAMIAVVLIARPDITILPPDKTPLMMVTATVPRPPVVDTTPPKPTERPTPKKDIAQNPQMTQPVTSAPPPPNPAPVDAPPDITPSNSPSAIANLAPVEPPKPVLVAPLSAGGIDGIVSEVPVTDFDQAAAIVNIVKPKVPVGASGKINVEVTVLSNGRVSRVKVLTQTPYTALVSDAASQCTFRPARRRGKPVTTTVVIQYDLDTNK